MDSTVGMPIGAHYILEDSLIHADGRAGHTRTHIGQVCHFEQSLQGAVLAIGAVQDGENHIQVGEFLECLGRS